MKTAIDIFLEQIVLKQVNGSVYLIPAITDVQIQEAKDLFQRQLMDAYDDGWQNGNNKNYTEADKYYNTTFTNQ